MALRPARHTLVDLLAPFIGDGPFRRLGRCAYRILRRRDFFVADSGRRSVVFAGDSLIDQWETLAPNFPGLKVANRGISGDLSSELLRRFREDVLACRPRAVVLLIGTNDLAGGAPPAQVAENLRILLGLAEDFEGGVPVVLCRLLPRTAVPGIFPDRIRELNALIDGLPSKHRGVSVCDTFTVLAAADGGPRDGCFVDGLHLSPDGYRRLRDALAPHLSRY